MTLATRALALIALAAASTNAPAQGTSPGLDSLFTRREVKIVMRDGVKLFTVILTPRVSRGALPIILSRTPYGTADWGGTLEIQYGFQELIREGYIFAFQDIRGRNQSGGKFLMNHPPRDRKNPASTDESSDTWDSIDWLVKNVPDNNSRVGMLGISYPGWLADMAAIDPHPALKALSPQATMGDAWMGDDFFHQGAFRLSYGLEYSWEMEASSNQSIHPSPNRFDMYDWYGSFPTLDSLANAVGAKHWPTWRRFIAHPAYDSAWTSVSVPRILTHTEVPMLTVGGWWDQEDMYGPQATYEALEKNDANGRNFIALGPWYHGEWFEAAGDSLGNVHFGSATGEYYRRNIEAPWFAYWLKGKGDGHFAEARVFDAGSGSWLSFNAWPPKNADHRSLYFGSNGGLSFDAPVAATGSDSFVSDPAHPVPYRPRPVELTYSPGSRWPRWMTEDQRFVDGRPDVLAWQTGPLTADVSIAGDITAHLFASTTGSDADWVVKLIDVFPDTVPGRPGMGGYELMVAGDILRGRYRKSFANAEAIPPNVVEPFTVDLHQQAYTFKKGHRIMVQVQSTWFPLYDRNPQSFVPNIFTARASDYHSATHRIYRDRLHPSRVEIPVIH